MSRIHDVETPIAHRPHARTQDLTPPVTFSYDASACNEPTFL